MKKKLSKPFRDGELIINAWKSAKLALKNGLGPAHNSNKDFGVFDGRVIDNTGYAIVVEKSENGCKPVDWYAWSAKSAGFGGWYKEDYDTFIKENPWVKEEWEWFDSLKK